MDITLGFIDLLRDDFIEKNRSRGVLSVASRGIYVWHMPALAEIFGDDSRRDLTREGNEIICEASKWSPKLAAACEQNNGGFGWTIECGAVRLPYFLSHATVSLQYLILPPPLFLH
ncbi:hypothetical protein Godav_002068 [Gossypium davidsonii]|uniref:Uncharacterized protein n=1 Tax=Gossypium davidsonii TaxID=34287 RepID=A0A7J8SWL6_GOSDV|nr:hypothetical protein [Gossypium davidsonii]